ncbi:hypothetical protein [Chondromyces crocatus]|nr:hypothetical protein [Chondromyces crocatus]
MVGRIALLGWIAVMSTGMACTLLSSYGDYERVEGPPPGGDASGTGGRGGAGGQGGAGGSGVCTCSADTACATYQCVDGACRVTFAAEGTPVVGTPVGDCQDVVCGPAGVPISKANDEDVPDDGNDCTVDSCVNGVPRHVAEADGSECGVEQSLRCVSGTCTGCARDEQCQQMNECMVPRCENYECIGIPKPSGTPVSNDSPTDCRKIECNGAGQAVVVAAPGETPDDGNPCTADSCVGMTPTFTPRPNGVSCPSNRVCYAGNCVGCIQDSHCTTQMTCRVAVCNANACGVKPAPDGTPCGSSGMNVCCMGSCDPTCPDAAGASGAGGASGSGGAGGGG